MSMDMAIHGTIPGVRDNKVYNDADSKDIEKYVLYTIGEDPYLYKDKEFTEKVTCDELRNMFLKGLILCGKNISTGKIAYLAPTFGFECGNNDNEAFGVSVIPGNGEYYSSEYDPSLEEN